MASRRRVKRARTVKRNPAGPARLAERQEEFAAYAYREDEIEQALISGQDATRLEAYFGEERYRELRDLARQAQQRSVRGGPRVLILPGIMGSMIGTQGPRGRNVIWFNPVDIIRGNLMELALNGGPGNLTSLGVIPLAYTALKLRLRIAGYDADFHHYDWRLSLDELGAQLSRRLKDEDASEVSLVAHSMGGLVARSAVALKAPKIKRLIMLGTPNYGSFAPAQAIRAVYSVVKQVAALDLRHDAKELSSKVFSTFPGLYQMLPAADKFQAVNLYDGSSWPKNGPQPRQDLLNTVQRIQQSLAKADDRFCLIAGVNQDTVIGLRLEDDEFVYTQSVDGDGTVPRVLAELPGAKTYYVEESHGSLPNNGVVGKAVSDLLDRGATEALTEQWVSARRGMTRTVREAELRAPAYGGRQGPELTQSEVRHALDEVVSPDAHEPTVLAATAAHELRRVVVGRRRQHRIDVQLAYGSITEMSARAYVLGIFRGVAPSGPALALDARLGGAIKDFTVRRMFSGNAGEVFVMPTGRHPVPADFILFAGLGLFDQFNPDVLELAAENVVRACVRTNVEEFATVLFGAGSGHDTGTALRHLLTGFFRGLQDADREHAFRLVTVCEIDHGRYDEIKQEVLLLSSTPLFDDVEVTLDEITLPAPLEPVTVRGGPPPGPQPIYLLVRQDKKPGGQLEFQSSVLTAGAKAAVITDVKSVSAQTLNDHLRGIESQNFTPETLDAFGTRLAGLVLADRVASVLPTMKDRHVVVVHDAPSSRIPWETIRLNGWSPAADRGLSRRYIADNLSVAKWLEQRQYAATLNLLLVVNPTEDLPGAETEGQRVRDLFGAHPAIKIDELRGAEATKAAVLSRFRSGKYDVVHYAGHAFFDAAHPSRSGILCAGRQVLSGADLAGIGNLPSLVFFNACEAGRIRRGAARADKKLNVEHRIERTVGLAEAFLRGGVANYLGTYWPVGDESAKRFAETFYDGLLNKQTIGQALSAGRETVRVDVKSVDWADYIHYGSYDFVLKQQP